MAEGEQRARLFQKYETERKNMESQISKLSTTQKIIATEQSYNDMVFWIQQSLGKIQAVSYSLDQIRTLNLYDFFLVKQKMQDEIKNLE